MASIEYLYADDFDFQRTYSEYGMTSTKEWFSRLENLFIGATKIMFLHSCMVVRTTNYGTDLTSLMQIKAELNALQVDVATFSPWTGSEPHGVVYNIYFAENCSPVKYPKPNN